MPKQPTLNYHQAKVMVGFIFGETARLQRVKAHGKQGWGILVQHKTKKDEWAVLGAGVTFELAIMHARKRRGDFKPKAETKPTEESNVHQQRHPPLPDWPIGTDVDVRKDDGSIFKTKTRSQPWRLGHGEAVILVEGISGGYALERVTKSEAANAGT